jgi:tungstate transport system substrate-binding protein
MISSRMESSLLRKYFLVIIVTVILAGCSESESPRQINNEIILATTTSTQDSGLLDFLLPLFQEDTGFVVKTIAVGTGKALKMAEEGNADVLLVHAPAAEKELLNKGFGINRTLVMHNDFIIVGPKDDPAGINGIQSPLEALKMINNTAATFASRGDDSGTHKKEMLYWNDLGITPTGSWYLESGQGMAATLRIASEKSGYTITDRATYLANLHILDLAIHVQGDPSLLNIYHVIEVNPQEWPVVNHIGAQAFSSFLVADDTQELIGNYGIEQYGQPLFFPDAGKSETDLGLD